MGEEALHLPSETSRQAGGRAHDRTACTRRGRYSGAASPLSSVHSLALPLCRVCAWGPELAGFWVDSLTTCLCIPWTDIVRAAKVKGCGGWGVSSRATGCLEWTGRLRGTTVHANGFILTVNLDFTAGRNWDTVLMNWCFFWKCFFCCTKKCPETSRMFLVSCETRCYGDCLMFERSSEVDRISGPLLLWGYHTRLLLMQSVFDWILILNWFLKICLIGYFNWFIVSLHLTFSREHRAHNVFSHNSLPYWKAVFKCTARLGGSSRHYVSASSVGPTHDSGATVSC